MPNLNTLICFIRPICRRKKRTAVWVWPSVDGEEGGGEGDDAEAEVEPGEAVLLVVEEDAAADVQQDADDEADNHALLLFVGLDEEEVDERPCGRHDAEEHEQRQHAPEAHAVGGEEGHENQRHRDVVDDDAPHQPLVDGAGGLHERHALEEGMEAEAQHQAQHRDAVIVVVFHMSVFGMCREGFEELLDEEACEDAEEG